ncbi:MAG TPA: hypothetical protein VKQ06_13305 [Gammaproteobacteria bacterium]|nr:hypothetical protein [Gammaproteobacteria bacterium]
MDWIRNVWVGRLLIIAGFLAGYNSIGATVRHLGNDVFLLVADSPNGPTHSWHHFLRELGGDFGAMAAILVIVFAAPKYRTPVAWWVMLILMVGFYAPFWVGTPFDPAYGAPNMGAEINHLMMAIPPLLGCFALWPDFRDRRVHGG